MPAVVHCREAEPGSYIYIGRPGVFGNPYRLTRASQRDEVIQQYQLYFEHRLAADPAFAAQVAALKGYDLGCWCAPRACHGDIILHYANEANNPA